jgi:pimeloyl-ACP methyl ester carboxylesterase
MTARTVRRDTEPAGLWSATTGVVGGRHVVLVHGSLDRSSGMLKLSRRLDESFRVTRYDRRGYGRSLAAGGPFDMAHQVGDLVGVIGHEPAPCVVVGHSFGGDVALATAQRHPDLIAGVVVYEAPLSWMAWWPASTAGADARAWQHDPGEAAERFMRRLIGDARWERLPAATRDARRAEGPALVGELAGIRDDAPWEAGAISVPVLPMFGVRSLAHHLESARVMGEWFGRDAVGIDGAKHFGVNTHPDVVGALVAGFAAECFR